MPKVKCFWWQLVTNWGDRLSPLLLQRFAHVDAVWAAADEAEVVCVGSVLGNLIKPTYTGIVLGSGKLFEDGIVPPRANILALRGEFARHRAWAKVVFPLWFYVSVTGVLVYFFLYRWWPAGIP